MTAQQLGQRVQTKQGKLRIIAMWESTVFYGKMYVILHDENLDRFIAVLDRGKNVTKTTPIRPYTQFIPRDARRLRGIQIHRVNQTKDPK